MEIFAKNCIQFKLKMQQKAFGGSAPLGELKRSLDSLAAMRGPTCKGEGREEKEEGGRKGEEKEKGKGIPGATILH